MNKNIELIKKYCYNEIDIQETCKMRRGKKCMKIHEIPVDRAVMLRLSKEGETASITARVKKVREGAILVHPIYINDKLFTVRDDENISVDVIYAQGDSKPFLWRSVAFKNIVINKIPHLSFYSDAEGVEHNRRASFRLPMDVVGMVDGGEHCIIKDISSSGVAFRLTKGGSKNVHAPVVVKFDGGGKMIELRGTIVRELTTDDGVVYGCKINGNMELDKYIADEQNKRFFQRKVKEKK